jgi:hypothetical protein
VENRTQYTDGEILDTLARCGGCEEMGSEVWEASTGATFVCGRKVGGGGGSAIKTLCHTYRGSHEIDALTLDPITIYQSDAWSLNVDHADNISCRRFVTVW